MIAASAAAIHAAESLPLARQAGARRRARRGRRPSGRAQALASEHDPAAAARAIPFKSFSPTIRSKTVLKRSFPACRI